MGEQFIYQLFWTEKLELIKNTDLHFYFTIKQTTYFVDFYLIAHYFEYELQESTFLKNSLSYIFHSIT